jgi:streptogramin lyase
VPTPKSGPTGIAVGADGNLWFTELLGNNIGRITPSGVFTEFATSRRPWGITLGADGNLWFSADGYFGRITPAGSLIEFPSHISDGPSVLAISSGPDGKLWYVGSSSDFLHPFGSVTLMGGVAASANFTSGRDILWHPDGSLWFTGAGPDLYRTQGSSSLSAELQAAVAGIAVGPDGNIWATEDTNRIARISPQ